ncbi:MAG: glucuronyl hydrolase, partial [Clostridia bacterium]|nr:glucuronyl hydrolase [Clostridia bacterium]
MLDKKRIENEIEFCLSRIDKGLERFRYGYFPTDGNKHNYNAFYNGGWTGGFWTAMLWLAYELTG